MTFTFNVNNLVQYFPDLQTDGVIGLNKPAGIHVTGTSENQMNIVGVIPEVMEAVGKPAGEIAKAADR